VVGFWYPNRIVIPTGAQRSGGTCGFSVCPSLTAADVSAALPFVIPSEAEGSAVLFSTHDPFLKVIFARAHRIGGPAVSLLSAEVIMKV